MSGNIRPQSSQLAEPLWTGLGIESGISVRELLSAYKKKEKKKKAQAGNEWSIILPKSSQTRKATIKNNAPKDATVKWMELSSVVPAFNSGL